MNLKFLVGMIKGKFIWELKNRNVFGIHFSIGYLKIYYAFNSSSYYTDFSLLELDKYRKKIRLLLVE